MPSVRIPLIALNLIALNDLIVFSLAATPAAGASPLSFGRRGWSRSTARHRTVPPFAARPATRSDRPPPVDLAEPLPPWYLAPEALHPRPWCPCSALSADRLCLASSPVRLSRS